jgi:hypothetical protein
VVVVAAAVVLVVTVIKIIFYDIRTCHSYAGDVRKGPINTSIISSKFHYISN